MLSSLADGDDVLDDVDDEVESVELESWHSTRGGAAILTNETAIRLRRNTVIDLVRTSFFICMLLALGCWLFASSLEEQTSRADQQPSLVKFVLNRKGP